MIIIRRKRSRGVEKLLNGGENMHAYDVYTKLEELAGGRKYCKEITGVQIM